MTAALLPEALWDLVEAFLPIPPRRPKGGRPRVSDRACLTGIVFVLRSGIPWEMLPQELGCGCGMTCWHPMGASSPPHPPTAGHAPKAAWQRRGTVALGCRADVRVAEPVSSPARPIRQTGRHPRSVPLAWLCADLLAVPSEDLGSRVAAYCVFLPQTADY